MTQPAHSFLQRSGRLRWRPLLWDGLDAFGAPIGQVRAVVIERKYLMSQSQHKTQLLAFVFSNLSGKSSNRESVSNIMSLGVWRSCSQLSIRPMLTPSATASCIRNIPLFFRPTRIASPKVLMAVGKDFLGLRPVGIYPRDT